MGGRGAGGVKRWEAEGMEIRKITLIGPGEVKVDLATLTSNCRKTYKVLNFFQISIPAETPSGSF
jgi:hypothetical protein